MESNNKQPVSYEELIISNMLQIEAIVQILEEKGIATKDDLLNKVKQLKTEMEERMGKNSKIS